MSPGRHHPVVEVSHKEHFPHTCIENQIRSPEKVLSEGNYIMALIFTTLVSHFQCDFWMSSGVSPKLTPNNVHINMKAHL